MWSEKERTVVEAACNWMGSELDHGLFSLSWRYRMIGEKQEVYHVVYQAVQGQRY